MVPVKKALYKKAYVELYELIKALPKNQYDKIPKEFIDYVVNQRDENYSFELEKNKPLLEQDYMVETRALIIKMYEKYLAEDDEKEFWNKYDKVCNNLIEEKKKQKYTNSVFEGNSIKIDEQKQNESKEQKERKNEEENKNNFPKKQEKNILKKFWMILRNIFKSR